MLATIIPFISNETGVSNQQVKKTLTLLSEGATIPFISRYRKEVTGNLDEVQVGEINALFAKLDKLEKRKESILETIAEQGKLTDDLKTAIQQTFDPNTLEDLYLPYKIKRKTKAEIARQHGLEPLAKIIMAQKETNIDSRAKQFITKEVKTIDEVLQGAREIMAEWVNENQLARKIIRSLFQNQATIKSKVVKSKTEEAERYQDYFDYEEPLNSCKSHRLLAIRRGEKEGFLKVKIRPPESIALQKLNKLFIKSDYSGHIKKAISSGYKRHLAPAIENEVSASLKQTADEEAIKVFSENLRQLLLSPPLGDKRVLAIDPGYRSGCKIVCLDEHGGLLHNVNIFPHPPQSQTAMAMSKISNLVQQYKIDAIAIGNGTAGRETESLVSRIRFKSEIQVFVVNEAGASVYSASSVAREEFPEYDVTVRGAISIGRRLVDPLAELVKVEPKSIGVGQYQHDVDQKLLKDSLDAVVMSCVNKVGVDVNTASKHLLTYVSGLGPQLAQNIVDYRSKNGFYSDRQSLLKVPRLGEKAFEQCAGFLRIKNGISPLDNSAVHPEKYPLAEKIAKTAGISINQLIGNDAAIAKINFEDFEDKNNGKATLIDIKKELLKPGLDPRKRARTFEFAKNIFKINDLKVGMTLPGIVTNITNFGAFVDVGVKQDGLIHLSNLADEYIGNPADFVKLNQHVKVKVISLEINRKRIGLSMKDVKQLIP